MQDLPLRKVSMVLEDIVELLANLGAGDAWLERRRQVAGLKHHNPASGVSMPGSGL